MKINVAVIGIGNMGKYHINNYLAMENVNLVAICDLDDSKLKKYKGKFNKYKNIDEMLNKEKIDLISLVTPTNTHYAIGKKILNKHINLLVEKPLAKTSIESKELIDLAKKNNVIISVGHIERYNPAVKKLKELIDEGHFGTITSINTKRVGPMPSQIKSDDVIFDLGVHDLDLVCYLMGEKPLEMDYNSGGAKLRDRDDYANIFLKFKKNISASLEINWITPIKIRKIYVTGLNGYAEVDLINQEIDFYSKNLVKSAEDYLQVIKDYNNSNLSKINIEKGQPLRLELDAIISAIQNNGKDLIQEDGIEVIKLIEKLRGT